MRIGLGYKDQSIYFYFGIWAFSLLIPSFTIFTYNEETLMYYETYEIVPKYFLGFILIQNS